MKYEYLMLTQTLAVSWDDGTLQSHAREMDRVFGEWLPRAAQLVEERHGEEWEFVSHDLVPTDDGLLISVMARRVARDSRGWFSRFIPFFGRGN